MKKIIILVGILMLCMLVFSQVKDGDIYGSVFTEGGSRLQGAMITLTGAEFEKRTVQSSKDGYFRFSDLPPGTYDLLFEAEGHRPGMGKGIRVYEGRAIGIHVHFTRDGVKVEITTAGKEGPAAVTPGYDDVPYGRQAGLSEAWDRFTLFMKSRGIKFKRRKRDFIEIHMEAIKEGLTECGVHERITIELFTIQGKNIGKLGTFENPNQIPEDVKVSDSLSLTDDLAFKIVFKNGRGEIKTGLDYRYPSTDKKVRFGVDYKITITTTLYHTPLPRYRNKRGDSRQKRLRIN